MDSEVLITFNASATDSRRDAVLSRIGGTRIKRFDALNVDHVRLPRGRRAADVPDLAGNMWINTAEIPNNSVDDDGNGYVDDVHGINTLTHSGDPMDDNGHGTHTAGTFAAIGNNGPSATGGTALVGVTWNSRILACKFLDAAGNGTDAGAIECFNYITLMKGRGVNIRVSNNSWGGPGRVVQQPDWRHRARTVERVRSQRRCSHAG